MLAEWRSGSHFLNTALEQHPKIKFFSDTLIQGTIEERFLWHKKYFKDKDFLLLKCDHSDNESLSEYFKKYIWLKDRIGYIKLEREFIDRHLSYDFLIKELYDPNIFKIFLSRNPLLIHISEHQAHKTKMHHLFKKDQKYSKEKITVNVNLMNKEIERTINFYNTIKQLHLPNTYYVTYFNLIRNFQNELQNIFKFLGLQNFVVESKVYRAQSWNYRNRINNLSEIQENIRPEFKHMLYLDAV